MKKIHNGILVCSGEYSTKNIGDYIQSVAQEQFYNNTDCYVEREYMNTFQWSDGRVNVIMNAWFMHHPEHFPPAQVIRPLFISTHIVPRIANRLLTPTVVKYLKQHEPIGARDTSTMQILQQYDIKSYFSCCLTLTLGLKYTTKKRTDNIIFVDPYYELGCIGIKHTWLRIFRACIYTLFYATKVKKIYRNFTLENTTGQLYSKFPMLYTLLNAASFYKTYHNLFDDQILFNAEYITHNVPQKLFNGNDAKMEYARRLISKYAAAKMVITSRIHCALPCLGVETPLLFVTSDTLENSNSVRSAGRMGGVISLFHTLTHTRNGIKNTSTLPFSTKNKIKKTTTFTNKDDYKEYRDLLIKKVNNFIYNYDEEGK